MSDAPKKITFFSKNQIVCPVCETKFYKEELFSGGGRLIAGDLTPELRRLFEASKKFGEVYPLIYVLPVCPTCYYTAYEPDFSEIPEQVRPVLKAESEKRAASISTIFDNLDFTQHRSLKEGAASYIFAAMCYDHFPREYSPTFKQGLSSLRAAWCFNDLHAKYPTGNFDYLAKLLYKKARFFYTLAIEREQKGDEPLGAIKHLGPDLDKNYGYDGLLYLTGYLEYKHGPINDEERRAESLLNAKRVLSRIFGMGKASKSKPSPLLDKARDLFELVGGELEGRSEDGEE